MHEWWLGLATLSALAGGCGSDGGKNPGSGGEAGAVVSAFGGAGAAVGAGGSVGGGGSNGAGMGQTAGQAPTLCPVTGSLISETGTLPDGAVLLRGLPKNAFLLFLQASDSHVFWGNNDAIHRTSIADGTDQVLYQPSGSSVSIAGFDLAGDTLYFTESGLNARGILKMPADGSSAPTQVVAENSINLAVVAGDYLYYTSLARHTVVRVALAGGAPTDIVSTNPEPRALLVAGGFVWFRLGNDDNSHLVRARVDAAANSSAGGSSGAVPAGAEDIAPVHLNGAAPVSDGTNVYYGDDDRLMMVPVAGGTPTQIGATTSQGGPIVTTTRVSSILPLSSGILWTQEGCADVKRVTPDGSALNPLLHNARAGRLVANGNSVFVTSGSQVLKVSRP